MWEKIISQTLLKNNLSFKISSNDSFNVNITSTLMELYGQVKENWTKDYYNVKQTLTRNQKEANSVSTLDSFRRRSPFIPFALKNETGSSLKFTTLISDIDKSSTPILYKSDENWIMVEPGQTVPFSFKSRGT